MLRSIPVQVLSVVNTAPGSGAANVKAGARVNTIPITNRQQSSLGLMVLLKVFLIRKSLLIFVSQFNNWGSFCLGGPILLLTLSPFRIRRTKGFFICYGIEIALTKTDSVA